MRRLPTRLVEHPIAEGHDEPGLLGQRDERAWRDHAALGMKPPDERLAAMDLTIVDVEDRLVMQQKAIVADRVLHLDFQPEAGLPRRIHGAFKQAVGIPSAPLGTVQGQIRVLHQDLGMARRGGKRCHGDASADANSQLLAVQIDRQGDRGHDALRERFCPRGRAVALQDDELVASQPCGGVGGID